MGHRLALHAPVDARPAGDVRAGSRLIRKVPQDRDGRGWPGIYLVDRKGVIRHEWGGPEAEALAQAIEDILRWRGEVHRQYRPSGAVGARRGDGVGPCLSTWRMTAKEDERRAA